MNLSYMENLTQGIEKKEWTEICKKKYTETVIYRGKKGTGRCSSLQVSRRTF